MIMYVGGNGDIMDANLYRRRVCPFSEVENGEVFTLRGYYDALFLKGTDYEGRYVLTNIYDGRSYLDLELGVTDEISCLVFKGSFVEDLSPDPKKFSLDWIHVN